jgi:hypothetical protein
MTGGAFGYGCLLIGMTEPVGRLFHVTSSDNRKSITKHGLDWRLMGSSRGIAGSTKPEQAGCFLSRNQFEAEFFVKMNNTGGPVDVWAVDDVSLDQLLESPEGFFYFPEPILARQLTLLKTDQLRRMRKS